MQSRCLCLCPLPHVTEQSLHKFQSPTLHSRSNVNEKITGFLTSICKSRWTQWDGIFSRNLSSLSDKKCNLIWNSNGRHGDDQNILKISVMTNTQKQIKIVTRFTWFVAWFWFDIVSRALRTARRSTSTGARTSPFTITWFTTLSPFTPLRPAIY